MRPSSGRASQQRISPAAMTFAVKEKSAAAWRALPDAGDAQRAHHGTEHQNHLDPVGRGGEFTHGVAERLADASRQHDGHAPGEPWREAPPHGVERLVRSMPPEHAQGNQYARGGHHAGGQQMRRLQQTNEPERRLDRDAGGGSGEPFGECAHATADSNLEFTLS